MNRSSVCIIIFPPPIACVPLVNITSILGCLIDDVYLITSKESIIKNCFNERVKIFPVSHKGSSNIFNRVFNYVHTQIKILTYLVLLSRKVNFFFFSIGGEALIFPILAARLLNKPVIIMPGGSATETLSVKKDPFSRFLFISVFFNLQIINRLIIYSNRLIQGESIFLKNRHKIVFAHEHFVDFTKFLVKTTLKNRKNLIGYIGRFSEEKGILNFIDSIEAIIECDPRLRFVICGNGDLYKRIISIIKQKNIDEYVEVIEWVSHDEIPNLLNRLKLLVVPSYTEGLPNIILEAMACGTPVLANNVGAIPDLIVDNQTGFLLECNDPPSISKKVIKLFGNSPLLENISKNSYEWVVKNFNKTKTIASWRKIFETL